MRPYWSQFRALSTFCSLYFALIDLIPLTGSIFGLNLPSPWPSGYYNFDSNFPLKELVVALEIFHSPEVNMDIFWNRTIQLLHFCMWWCVLQASIEYKLREAKNTTWLDHWECYFLCLQMEFSVFQFSVYSHLCSQIMLITIERFSIECRKTKTRVITLAYHKGHR